MLLGLVGMAFTGRVAAIDVKDGEINSEWWTVKPMSINFDETGISDIVVKRKNGKEHKISFTELLDIIFDD